MPTSIVEEMMLFMVNLGLFENIEGKITCLKMSTRTDEYTQKLINNINNYPDSVPTISQQNPENSALIEEKRREEKRREINKGYRLTNDFFITDDYFAEAKKIHPNISNEKIISIGEEFKDYWIGVAGAKGVKLDWLATWRNWVRKQNILPSQSKQTKPVDFLNGMEAI